MDNQVLRAGKADEYVLRQLEKADEAVRVLASKLFEGDEFRSADRKRELLGQAAVASEEQVRALVTALEPPLAESMASAWVWIRLLAIARPDGPSVNRR